MTNHGCLRGGMDRPPCDRRARRLRRPQVIDGCRIFRSSCGAAPAPRYASLLAHQNIYASPVNGVKAEGRLAQRLADTTTTIPGGLTDFSPSGARKAEPLPRSGYDARRRFTAKLMGTGICGDRQSSMRSMVVVDVRPERGGKFSTDARQL